MEVVFTASLRALRSLFTPRMFGIFLLSVLTTIIALLLFVGIASSFFHWLSLQLQDHLWASSLPFIGTAGSIMLAWFIFPGIMPVIVNFFDARIAQIIEEEDYPATPAGAHTSFWKELWHDTRFSLLAITLNILIIPFYLLIPVLHLIPFYLLNGYLLGHEFFMMAARRHIPIEQAAILHRAYSRTILGAGVTLAFLATVPIINLVAPFWGVALMVHLYHLLARTPSSKLIK